MMRVTMLYRLIVLLGISLSLPSFTSAEAQPLKPLDIFDMQWVSDPQISPDAQHIAYVRNRFDVMTDSRIGQIWTIKSDGQTHEPLTESTEKVSSPRWSPDGSRLAYVSNEAGKTSQIHVRWMQSGRDAAITRLQHSPGSLAWSPDGEYLAFTQFVAHKRDPIAKLPTKPKGAKWNEEPKVFEDLIYRRDGRGYFQGGYSQIFIVAASGGKPIQLTSEPFSHSGTLSWSSDGRSIYYSANYDDWQQDLFESEIYRVDVTDRVTVRITNRDGLDTAPALSPDGKRLAYLGNDDIGGYQTNKIYLTDADDHAPKQLVDIDRTVTSMKWSADSRRLYFTYLDQGQAKLARTNLSGKYETVASGLGGGAIGRPYVTGNFSIARNGTVAHDVNLARQPANLAVTRGGDTRVLTNLNRDWLTGIEINAPEEIWYESSHDGQRIQGWIVKPPGFDANKKYPLALEIHGGPHSAYGDVFSAEVQLYAAAGYVVLYTNPRGSTSYGEDFARMIYQDYPGHDYDDLISGVDAVIDQGYIDRDQLFVTGGSGGGILTAWILTKTDRFAAAVAQKPVINWYTMSYVSDIGAAFWRNWFAVPPWEDPLAYLEKSPLQHVNKISTPTMLLTGEQDWRTPMSESEQFYLALQINNVPTALVRIPNSSHSIAARPSGLIAKAAYVIGWFDRYKRAE